MNFYIQLKTSLIAIFLFPVMVLGQQDFEKIESRNFKNLYKLNDSLFRSEQPSRKGFKELEGMGVQSIINFRRLKEDRRKARSTDLTLNWIPIRTKELTEAQLVEALRVIKDSEKPVLIHCWHGSDRTGAVAAAYRVVFQNWSKEDAIRELRYDEFGYHENWYPNIITLINSLDVPAIRKELEL
ncbi:tyrosine-protein phosphatase [Aureitalea sp. L0-47]|uniref:tyrosine-protein phosphatase n=1 Tax=Aureitalea sp. L0-47 TaxID=2816962 RepID=UPI0022385E95|nr:tyrosine-protein phosphatase [Aureitalea sp. L0-47]MCW5519429.1 tyrosine-protein phosphatase [Aureitalea sp. L0-47]